MIVTPLLLLMLLLCTGFTLSRIFIVLFFQIVVMCVRRPFSMPVWMRTDRVESFTMTASAACLRL